MQQTSGDRPRGTRGTRLPSEDEWRTAMSGPPVIRCAECSACRWHPSRTACIYGTPASEVAAISTVPPGRK